MRNVFFMGLAILGVACGGAESNPFGDGGGGDGASQDGSGGDGGGGDGGADTGADTGPACENLECQIAKCDAGATTTLAGRVTTPNGMYAVYDAQVYVPNAKLADIADGVSCEACQAPLTGKPLMTGQLGVAVTDANGQFTLKDVPVGSDIPIVIQLGKWRRVAKVQVAACTSNTLTTAQGRLPKNQSEGHLPLIAVQTGCDGLECTLAARIGIDPNEFTGPAGSGRVHVYRGHDDGQGLPSNPGDAYALWGNLQNMKKYDLFVQACECDAWTRDTMGPAYDNMKSYLEAGGRLIAGHYHYNWFASAAQMNGDTRCKGPTDFNGVADWGVSTGTPPADVENAHPRGAAFASWLAGASLTNMQGQLPLNGTRNDVRNVSGATTRWLSTNAKAATYYLTFNTPVGGMKQCGRAAFMDEHLRDGAGGGGTWPSTTCQSQPTDPSGEAAFSFLFFDVFSCVQDDTKAPIVPPTK